MQEIISLEELKKIELEIMKKVHTFCEENNIKYFLCGGTLIGAVRHQGFIPWDDDIDIYMVREEYDKFVDLFQKSQDELGLELVNHKTKRHYGRLLSKVIGSNTVLVETQYKTDDPIGVFIDIWPIDGLPNNNIKRNLYIKTAVLLKKMILAASMNYDKNYKMGRRILVRICSIFNPDKLLNKLEKMARKYDVKESDMVKCFAGLRAVYPKEVFDERILMQFEEEYFYGPKEYDQMLKIDYGDYMQLPPVEQQKPHHVMNVYYK